MRTTDTSKNTAKKAPESDVRPAAAMECVDPFLSEAKRKRGDEMTAVDAANQISQVCSSARKWTGATGELVLGPGGALERATQDLETLTNVYNSKWYTNAGGKNVYVNEQKAPLRFDTGLGDSALIIKPPTGAEAAVATVFLKSQDAFPLLRLVILLDLDLRSEAVSISQRGFSDKLLEGIQNVMVSIGSVVEAATAALDSFAQASEPQSESDGEYSIDIGISGYPEPGGTTAPNNSAPKKPRRPSQPPAARAPGEGPITGKGGNGMSTGGSAPALSRAKPTAAPPPPEPVSPTVGRDAEWIRNAYLSRDNDSDLEKEHERQMEEGSRGSDQGGWNSPHLPAHVLPPEATTDPSPAKITPTRAPVKEGGYRVEKKNGVDIVLLDDDEDGEDEDDDYGEEAGDVGEDLRDIDETWASGDDIYGSRRGGGTGGKHVEKSIISVGRGDIGGERGVEVGGSSEGNAGGEGAGSGEVRRGVWVDGLANQEDFDRTEELYSAARKEFDKVEVDAKRKVEVEGSMGSGAEIIVEGGTWDRIESIQVFLLNLIGVCGLPTSAPDAVGYFENRYPFGYDRIPTKEFLSILENDMAPLASALENWSKSKTAPGTGAFSVTVADALVRVVDRSNMLSSIVHSMYQASAGIGAKAPESYLLVKITTQVGPSSGYHLPPWRHP